MLKFLTNLGLWQCSRNWICSRDM